MKKLFLLSAVLFGGFISSYAGEAMFEVKHNGVTLTDGQEVEVKNYAEVLGEMYMKFEVDVTNNSDATKRMRMIREEVQLIENTTNDMCWDLCMEPTDSEAQGNELLSGETEHPYARLNLNAEGDAVIGTSIINYTFKSGNKGEATITVTVKYIYEGPNTGVSNVQSSQSFIVSQPAGAQHFMISTFVAENSPLQLEVVDLSGRTIEAISLLSGENNSVLTNTLSKGCYLLILKNENKVISTRKGIIR